MSIRWALPAAVFLAMVGCSSNPDSSLRSHDLGTGVNTVDRTYSVPAADVYDAAVAGVKSYDLKIEKDSHDDFGGDLAARRGDGRLVSVKVTALEKQSTRASVRVEPGDRNLADLIQERIAQKLGLGEAKGGLFGGSTMEGTYNVALEQGLNAAEQTAGVLAYTSIRKETHETWAQLDARTSNSTPVRFKLARDGDRTNRIQVSFIAGTSRNDDMKALAVKMKEEFERHIQSSSR